MSTTVNASGSGSSVNAIFNSPSATISSGSNPAESINESSDLGLTLFEYFGSNERPFNYLNGSAIDPTFRLAPFPFSPPNSKIGATYGYTFLNYLAGMLLPKYIINCPGTIFTLLPLMMQNPYHLQFSSNVIKNLSVQKMYGLHIDILEAEINLGLDYTKLQLHNGDMDGNYPSSQLVQKAANMPNFDLLKWDQTKVNDAYSKLLALKSEVDSVAPDDFIDNWKLWDIMSGLNSYHIIKVLLLSGFSLETIKTMKWGDTTFGAFSDETVSTATFAVAQYPLFYDKKALNASCMLPFKVPFNMMSETITSSKVNDYGIVSLDSGLKLEQFQILPYDNIIVNDNAFWKNTNLILRNMYTPQYIMNCPGVASIWMALTGNGCDPSLNINPNHINNTAVQQGLQVIINTLIGEVDLCYNWYNITQSDVSDGSTGLMLPGFQGPGPLALQEASGIIAADPSKAWDVSTVLINVNRLIDLSGAIRTAAPEKYDLPNWTDPSFDTWDLEADLYSLIYTYIITHSVTLLKLTLQKSTLTNDDLGSELVGLIGNSDTSRYYSSPFVGTGGGDFSVYTRMLQYTGLIPQPFFNP